MSIATQIEALAADRTAIQSAISAKGGTVSSADGFDDFATAIGTIPSGGGSGNLALYKDGTIGTAAGDFLNRPGTGVFNKEATALSFRATGTAANTSAVITSENAVDLTDYDYLLFDVIRGGTGVINLGYCGSANLNDRTYEDYIDLLGGANLHQVVALDISEATGSHYIKFHSQSFANTALTYVSRIILVKL